MAIIFSLIQGRGDGWPVWIFAVLAAGLLVGWAFLRHERRRPTNALIEPSLKALDTALNAVESARHTVEAALQACDFDPRELERVEERLFALRAASRKYATPVDNLAELAARYEGDLAESGNGGEVLFCHIPPGTTPGDMMNLN